MRKEAKPQEMEAALAALPNKRGHKWTPETDRLILKYGPTKGITAVASILGIPRATVDQRYRSLKAVAK